MALALFYEVVNAIAHIDVKPTWLTKERFVVGGAAAVTLASGVVLGIRLRFHHHAPQQPAILLALHQQAADELGGNELSGAGEEGLRQGWEGFGGYGSGSVHSRTVAGLILLTETISKEKAMSKEVLKHWTLLLTLLAFPAFALNALATPVITSAKRTKLDKPGLWLSAVRWTQPETGAGKVLTFRVYCPTGMMRDVTDGRWGDAAKVTAMKGQGYPIGVVETAFQQACK